MNKANILFSARPAVVGMVRLQPNLYTSRPELIYWRPYEKYNCLLRIEFRE